MSVIEDLFDDWDEIDGSPNRGRNAPFATHEDYRFDLSNDKFIYVPAGASLKPSSVDDMIPSDLWRVEMVPRANGELREVRVPPHKDISKIERGLVIDGRTWWPGKPQFIKGWSTIDGNIVRRVGGVLYNSYIPPTPPSEYARINVIPFLRHLVMLLPDKSERRMLLDRMSHVVQNTGVKINGICVLGGGQGVGKDSAFVPLARWLGPSRMRVVSGNKAGAKWNGWVQSIVTIINETSSSKQSAVSLYEALKGVSASPPEFIPVELKRVNEFEIHNCVSIFTSTNHMMDLFAEGDDRRLLLLTCLPKKEWMGRAGKLWSDKQRDAYFDQLHAWFAKDENWQGVIAYLRDRDISGFNAKAPPVRTEGFNQLQRSIEQRKMTPLRLIIEGYKEHCEEQRMVSDVIVVDDMFAWAKTDMTQTLEMDPNDISKLKNSSDFVYRMRDSGFEVLGGNGRLKLTVEGTQQVYRTVYVSSEIPSDDMRREYAREVLLARLSNVTPINSAGLNAVNWMRRKRV